MSIGAVFFFAILTLPLTFTIGWIFGTTRAQNAIARRGFGRYHPVTRQFQWVSGAAGGNDWVDWDPSNDG